MKSKWLSMCGIYFISAVLMATKNCREIPKNDRKIAMNKVHNIGQQGGRTGEGRVVGLGTEVGSARGSSRPALSNTVATNQVGYLNLK